MTKVSSFEQQSVDKLRSFIAKCDFIPFLEYGVKRDSIAKYLIEELQNVTYHGGLVLIAQEQEEIVGLISLERSAWDSEHFGTNISKIAHFLAHGCYLESLSIKKKLISSLLAQCQRRLLLHITARVYKEDLSSIHALESNAFRLMDVLVTYSFEFKKEKKIDKETQFRIRLFDSDDLPELEQIAKECFEHAPIATDRFHADPSLPKEKSGELYVRWLADSAKDASAKILVAEVDGKPIGFNICNVNKSLIEKLGLRLGTIALTAVKPSERGKLVAVSLLNASLSWFADKVDIVETGGQVSNYAIQRAWNKTGFKIVKSQCTFHWSVLPDTL